VPQRDKWPRQVAAVIVPSINIIFTGAIGEGRAESLPDRLLLGEVTDEPGSL